MKGHGAKFGRRKEAAIAALISTRTLAEAATEANVSVRTLIRWMKIPEFREELNAVRRDGLSQAGARLQQACGAAASTLIKALVDPSITPTKVKAAQCILEQAHKAFEREDVDIRLTKLERNAPNQ